MNRRNTSRSGSAMILAIVATTLLFIIGSVFLLSSRTYRQSVATVESHDTQQAAINAVVERINTVLVEDLFGVVEPVNMLNSPPTTAPPASQDADEYWDYSYTSSATPGRNDDYWLADLEPEYRLLNNTPYYFWRHISDIYGSYYATLGTGLSQFGLPDPATGYTYFDAKLVAWSANIAPYFTPYWYWVSNADAPVDINNPFGISYKPTLAVVTTDNSTDPTINPVATYLDADQAPINYPQIWPWGALADADGDGVSDARWVRIPGVNSPKGDYTYAAVRIIDNCAMININTAFRNPEDPTNPDPGHLGRWDGSQLTQVNLKIFIAKEDADDGLSELNFQGARFGTVGNYAGLPDFTYLNYVDNDNLYEARVAERVLNPAIEDDGTQLLHYTPFTIDDELSLRYRYLLHTDAKARCGWAAFNDNNQIIASALWQATFDPGFNNVGKKDPYTDPTKLSAWFAHVKPDIDEYNPSLNINNGTAFIGNYNRRHLATTYSFDRVIIPKKAILNTSTPPSFDVTAMFIIAGVPTPITDTMPGDVATANSLAYDWNQWTNWTDPLPANWSYRPICVNDFFAGGATPTPQQISQLAAAIWLGLPQSNVLTVKSGIANLFGYWVGTANEARNHIACQMAVNLIDYLDTDNNITSLTDGANTYYGYEGNAGKLYIARLGVIYPASTATNTNTQYSITLYNPGPGIIAAAANQWSIDVNGTLYNIPGFTLNPLSNMVIIDRAAAKSPDEIDISEFPNTTVTHNIANFSFVGTDTITILGPAGATSHVVPYDSAIVTNFPSGSSGSTRAVNYTGDRAARFIGDPADGLLSIQNIIDFTSMGSGTDSGGGVGNYGLLDDVTSLTNAIGTTSSYQTQDIKTGQMRNPAEIYDLTFIGGFRTSATVAYPLSQNWYNLLMPTNDILATHPALGKFDAADSDYGNLIHYITVFNPFNDFVPGTPPVAIDNDNRNGANTPDELGVAGRININTAPWFIIAQLPWVRDTVVAMGVNEVDRYRLARAITAYRDKEDINQTTNPLSYWGNNAPNYTTRAALAGTNYAAVANPPAIDENPGFRSISELINVTQRVDTSPAPITDFYFDIRRYGRDNPNVNQDAAALVGFGPMYPVNTPPANTTDTLTEELDERDVILNRVGNLATVRSDTFTAYIAVRVGETGPVRRVMAIFDRSNVFDRNTKPKLVALQPVPDPR